MDLDLRELNEWLEQFLNFERTPNAKMLKLETMRTLCREFGHPERACPCFHVAGSKGKGTIAASIAAILRSAGYRTGVYASPHVVHFSERVSTGEEPFPPEIYDVTFLELKTGISDLVSRGVFEMGDLTWFEMVTLFSMLVFREAGVDYAIYEVGMGGRLDATNVVTPVCCCFGLIELEHTQFLGDILAKIAWEKAGILKLGVPAVSVAQDLEVQTVLEEVAASRQTKVDFVPASGFYLEDDFAVAKIAVKKALPEIAVSEKGLEQLKLPARYEKILKVPSFPDIKMILIDGAHTERSIGAVLKRIQKEGLISDVELLFACAKDKNVEKIAEEIVDSGLFSRYFLTHPSDAKLADLPRMKRAFLAAFEKRGVRESASVGSAKNGKNQVGSSVGVDATENKDAASLVLIDADFQKVIREALETADRDQTSLVVLGSFYLAGEVKKILEGLA